MVSSLQTALRPSTAASGMREELCLNLQRSAAAVGHQLERKLRPRGLSPTQYNVLRILRGAGMAGLCQYEIGERLVAQVPDVPRILERMEKAGWVKRERAASDRRMVMASLTEAGRAAVDELDGPVLAIMNGLFRSMSEREMERLNELLVAARDHPAEGFALGAEFGGSGELEGEGQHEGGKERE